VWQSVYNSNRLASNDSYEFSCFEKLVLVALVYHAYDVYYE